MKSLRAYNSPAKSIEASGTLATDTNGTGVDLSGFDSAEVVVSVGAAAFTINGSNFLSLELEESDTLGSGYTDVAASDIDGGNGGANGQFALIDSSSEDDVVVHVGYTGSKKYIRVVANFTGTVTGGIPVCALVNRGRSTYLPAV